MDKIDTLIVTDAGLLEAFDFARRAHTRALEAFVGRFPAGATISWGRKGIQHGQVVRHGYSGKVEVRNVETDATYWVYAADVLRALRP